MNSIYRLDSCVWEIPLACCFQCRYCGSRAGKARENELSTQECLVLLFRKNEKKFYEECENGVLCSQQKNKRKGRLQQA